MNKWIENIQKWPVSQICILCSGETTTEPHIICTNCLNDLPWLSNQCLCCALPLPTSGLCPSCLPGKQPIERAVVPLLYDSPVRELILNLKFKHNLLVAKLFGWILVHKLRSMQIDKPSLIIPVPLHPQRLKVRGFNQATELALPISKALQIPIEIDGCVRIRETEPQSGMTNAKVRRQNVAGAFEVRCPINERHVALIDDVITTGSTVRELAKTLRCRQVERIDVWAAARVAQP